MCSLKEQIKICNKHHLYFTDAMKLMGASYLKFKPVWDDMVVSFEKKTGKRLLASWGLPTGYVLNYLDINLEAMLKAYEREKGSA